MIVVLASRFDVSAARLVERWRDRGARLVTPEGLSVPGWCHESGALDRSRAVLDGDVVEAVSKLKQEQEGILAVHGSPTLAQTLIDNDLVDELHLMVFPVILGTGKRLFGETSDKKPWRLTESRTVGDGVTIAIYQRA